MSKYQKTNFICLHLEVVTSSRSRLQLGRAPSAPFTLEGRGNEDGSKRMLLMRSAWAGWLVGWKSDINTSFPKARDTCAREMGSRSAFSQSQRARVSGGKSPNGLASKWPFGLSSANSDSRCFTCWTKRHPQAPMLITWDHQALLIVRGVSVQHLKATAVIIMPFISTVTEHRATSGSALLR